MIIPAMSQASQLRLSDWGVIRAQGADAASFLHSQLTQDFALLDRDRHIAKHAARAHQQSASRIQPKIPQQMPRVRTRLALGQNRTLYLARARRARVLAWRTLDGVVTRHGGPTRGRPLLIG